MIFFEFENGLPENDGGKSGTGEEEEWGFEDQASREGVLPWELGGNPAGSRRMVGIRHIDYSIFF